ncbi:glycoside hydrolase family 35 protein [Coniophora puteana RWD-64-598 SS2]|uniref:beta-galactosidase n=1 Tax=Coniophora puteana (strain RWD-64-598) TaxID=741705 RepID=A0A5M3MDB6_CONPW|nr:glycoside hydrolase family 35 protein [Coniophora puteana RWD-64-598 SS2]EIW77017.1 glycoside hydrolase family 35 protein [Coniophora puteana RWD-64-598 SS2]
MLCVLASPVRSFSWTPVRSEDALTQSIDVRAEDASSNTTLLGNGRQTDVQWDAYSLVVKGQRVFINSGEFHTFRLPVPDLWRDILQKFKAAGYNTISLYTHMALLNPAPGVLDFNDWRAVQPLYEIAKEVGIFIVLRPGPYINAETTAGGIAHWLTSTVNGTLRTNATDWYESWQDYMHGIVNNTLGYQITEGGPILVISYSYIIDNEYGQYPDTHAEYFAELEAFYNSTGIVVPLTANDPGEGDNWVTGTGAVELYGLDAYPQGFDCSTPENWSPVVTNWHSYHEDLNPWQPWYFPEFQGGAFDAWGPDAAGYENCRVLTGADFENVFYLDLWSTNAKLISYYMLYGGTSWGGLPFPGVYTSYDYGSAIAENRVLSWKYPEVKRQGLFLRSSPEFYKTDWVGNSSSDAVTVSNPDVFVTYLRNPDTSASFYIARQNDSTSTDTTTFKLNVTTSAGSLQVPQVASNITLSGRQSKIIFTDYTFGTSSKILWSTAQIMYAGRIGDRDVVLLYGDSDQGHETAVYFTGTPYSQANSSDVTTSPASESNATVVNFLPGIQGLVTVYDSTEQLVLFADTVTAGNFWSPDVPPIDTSDALGAYWQFGTNTSVLIGGPYLVRNATIAGSTLALYGDLNATTSLTVVAPPSVGTITWNGAQLSVDAAAGSGLTHEGGFVGQLALSASASGISVPQLAGWKYADSLPEVQSNFSDAGWTLANHTTTVIPFPPYYGDGRILYGCDYGYCENINLWRGHFNASQDTQWMNLSINGGEAFAASVWVNDVFLNTSYGNSTNDQNSIVETDQKFYFPEGSLNIGGDNVVTVVQRNVATGNEEKSPRGIRGFVLNTGDFGDWYVQGKIGGYTNYPDKVRGVLNEGGLYGERAGWHLPGFDTSSWEARDLSQGLPNSTAGVGFFVTTFDLSIPAGYDVPIAFNFESELGQTYRARLFVNGWMMGQRVANLGPQYQFPVHQGILDYNGTNTVAVALWSMESTAVSPTLNLTVQGVYEGGVGNIALNNPGWSATGRETSA